MAVDRPADVKGRTRVMRGVIPNWVPAPPTATPFAQVRPDTLAQVNDTFERQITVAGLSEPVRVTYGNDLIGAQITRGLIGAGGSLLVICIWGRGPISAINSITIDDAAPGAGITFTNYLGTASQTVDADLVAGFALLGITHTDALPGIAYSVGKFPPGADIGSIKANINGRFLYDERNGSHVLGTPSTWSYATVPGLALANLIYDSTYGLGGTISDWTTVSAVANANDALVSGEKKRMIGITLDRRLPGSEWIEIMRAHAGCFVIRDGAGFRFVADAPTSSTRTFTQDDLIDPALPWNIANISEQSNVVQCAYTNTNTTPWSTGYAMYPSNGQPAVSGESLRLTRLELSGCQRYSQAERECIEYLNKSRLGQLTIPFESYADALDVEVGKVYTMNDGGLFGGLDFWAIKRTMIAAGNYRILLKKYDPAVYSSIANADPTTGNTTLPTPQNPPIITGLTLTEIVEPPGVGGAPRSSISCTWNSLVATYPFLSGYRVYVIDDQGNLVDEGEPVGNYWTSRPLPAPQRLTVYAKSKSSIATSTLYDSETITLSGSTQSLTLLTSSPVLSAGSTLLNYDAYTLYPGDPYLRVAPRPSAGDIDFATQFATDAISAATTNVLSHNRLIINQYRDDTYAKTAAIDLGASKQFVIAIIGAPVTPVSPRMTLGFESADSLAGPWSYAQGTVVSLTGRYVRFVVCTYNPPALAAFPDGTGGPLPASYAVNFYQADFGAALISVYGATVEETDEVTTSASGPVTVTLSGKYSALRDLQVSAIQGAGTAVVTVSPPSLSTVSANTFEVNATVAGARVAVPVRWNFKGAV